VTTMELLQVARDMFDSGRVAASYRVMDEAQPAWEWRGCTASRVFMGGAPGSCSFYRTLAGGDRLAIARRLTRSTTLLDWAETLHIKPRSSSGYWVLHRVSAPPLCVSAL